MDLTLWNKTLDSHIILMKYHQAYKLRWMGKGDPDDNFERASPCQLMGTFFHIVGQDRSL